MLSQSSVCTGWGLGPQYMEHGVLRGMVDKWVVRILLECFLVLNMSMQYVIQ